MYEVYDKLIEMSKNDDCLTWYLLYYFYHQKNYELVGIDLSRETNTINSE